MLKVKACHAYKQNSLLHPPHHPTKYIAAHSTHHFVILMTFQIHLFVLMLNLFLIFPSVGSFNLHHPPTSRTFTVLSPNPRPRPRLKPNPNPKPKPPLPPLFFSTSSTSATAAEVGDKALDVVDKLARAINDNSDAQFDVTKSMEVMERDMSMLDQATGQRPQLSSIELLVLISSVAIASTSPFLFPLNVVEVLAPTCAAISASIGVSAEYVGRVAVANGKEIAAITMQAAAEAEALLASSERAKAILPLCVGVGATAASFALLCPILIDALAIKSLQSITEIYLLCPLVAILSASIGGLACQESGGLASRAISLGNR